MAKRLTRARQKIRVAGIPYRVPSAHDLPERWDTVLATTYLMFNEGYAATAGPELTHPGLADTGLPADHADHRRPGRHRGGPPARRHGGRCGGAATHRPGRRGHTPGQVGVDLVDGPEITEVLGQTGGLIEALCLPSHLDLRPVGFDEVWHRR